MTPEPLEHPPITEALLELGIEPASDFQVDVAGLESLAAALAPKYPDHGRLVESTLAMPRQGPASLTPERASLLFRNADGRQVVQARRDGMTFSRLEPYESWTRFVEEARQAWDGYVGVARPANVSRVGVRYVNRIDVPLPILELKDYFLTFPEVARELPQALGGFFMQLSLPLPEHDANAWIALASGNSTDGRTISIFLDILVHRPAVLAPMGELLWSSLERLRAAKNEVFFKTITPKTRELFR